MRGQLLPDGSTARHSGRMRFPRRKRGGLTHLRRYRLITPYSWGAGRANAAFRFAVIQTDKVRACDDLKYGCANLACATRTPIALATWGHIGQICLDVADAGQPWSFFKADHKAAYKNLPLNPAQSDTCIATIRNPPDGLRCGFRPRSLPFGAVAAVLHYNCFSRFIAVLACQILGLPLVNYFDDLGSMSISSISEEALETFTEFRRISKGRLKKEKSGLGNQLPFLGLVGDFPAPDNDMTLSASLTDGGGIIMGSRIGDFLKTGRTFRKELDSLTGSLSFSQTSVFGRLGRCLVPVGERSLLRPGHLKQGPDCTRAAGRHAVGSQTSDGYFAEPHSG